jgi:hypothetical protein
MRDERKLGWGNDPSKDIDWCRDRGYRAFIVSPGNVPRTPALLLARDTQLVGIATVGDTLVYDGKLISIEVGS